MSYEERERLSDPGLPAGTVIAGRFRVERKLGEGGMGTVYAAVNTATSRSVALKVMHPEYAAKKEIVRRFMREAKAATVITHPNVIEVLDLVEGQAGEPIMVMELLEGESLEALLERRGALSVPEVARIMIAVVSAVGAAHARGIIHRDLKPENIFVTSTTDGQLRPKVLDFGIAKILDPTQINEENTKSGATRTGSMLGTPYYMSIEQACGEKDIDHRTDIWSIGVILYVMLSGRRPYQGDNYGQILKSLMTDKPPSIGTLVPNLPAEIAELVDRCMARNRTDRPADLREVHHVLSQYCIGTVVQAPPSASRELQARSAAAGATLAAASMYTSHISTSGATATAASRRGVWMVAVPVLAVALGASALWIGRSRPLPSVQAAADPPASISAAPPTTSTAPVAAIAPELSASVAQPSASATPSGVRPTATAAPEGKGRPKDTGPSVPPTKEPTGKTGGGIIEKSPY